MKILYRLTIVVFISLLAILTAKAQTYHDWPGKTIPQTVDGDLVFENGGTHILILKDDVSITGTITVRNATTLRIRNESKRTVTIRNGVTGDRTTPMFRVYGMGKLAFNYDDREYIGYEFDRIILDGGAAFSEMDRTSDPDGVWRLSATAGSKFKYSAIESIGALEICNTTIRNFYFPETYDNENGVIGLATSHIGTYAGTGNEFRYTTIRNCTIEKCKGKAGTFIMIGHGDGFLNKSIDPSSTDRYGSYRYITIENVTVQNCVSFGDSQGWGGLIRARGASLHSLKIKNTTFKHNFSHGDGAVLWWNAGGHPNTKCTIDGCEFTENRAMREAGAIRIEGNLEFTGAKTTVSWNECLGKNRVLVAEPNTYTYVTDSQYAGNGGGIQIFGYAGGGMSANTLTYRLPTCLEVANNNAAGYGGGVAFDFTTQSTLPAGTVINTYYDGVTIKGNSADKGGGGMFMGDNTDPTKNYKFNLYLNSGTVNENTAPDGGGIYVQKINVLSSGENVTSICKNTVSAGSGGGVYLEKGTISLQSAKISENVVQQSDHLSVYGGGGVFVKDGSFEISSGEISDNSSALFGGGVFVYNDAQVIQNITLTNGNIYRNNSKYGGGIAAYGSLELNINNITIEGNSAQNGGGVFCHGLANNQTSNLKYNSGQIRYNVAEKDSDDVLTTVYQKDYSEYSGVGGGIYAGRYTTFSLSRPDEFGIYGNVADNAADDIFGYNEDVTISLPDVSGLNLSGYNLAKVHNLFWAEDYLTDDLNYDKGLKLKGTAWNSDKTNQRYRDVREKGMPGEYFFVDFKGQPNITYNNKYLSLTMGWNVSSITIVKSGMLDGENAVFKIFSGTGSGKTEYMTVVLTDRDRQSDGTRTKNITLNSDGLWEVQETGWTWTYSPNSPSIARNLDAQSSEEDRIFRFTNNVDTTAPEHAESIVVNHMNL